MNKNFNNKFWAGKKVFVTGHTGFKGSWLCIFLKLLGAKVTGYALQPKTKPSLFKLGKIDRILEKSRSSKRFKNVFWLWYINKRYNKLSTFNILNNQRMYKNCIFFTYM